MSDEKEQLEVEKLPKAKIKRRHWRFSIVWVVPLIAAIVAGYLVYQRMREFGPTITVTFRDVRGLKAGQTPVQYLGVTVGEVKSIGLSDDHQSAVVKLSLKRSANWLAREQTQFWIVRPQFQGGSFTGLGTIVAGPYIELRPGEGGKADTFTGLEESPVAEENEGLKIILLSAHLNAVKTGSPVYYRGVEVGVVERRQLSTNAQTVETHALIRKPYSNLVRAGSKFWNVSGVDVKLGLFRGAEINVESLRSVWAGGISFATPTNPGEPAKDGAVFSLYDEPQKEWLMWSPAIEIPQNEISPPVESAGK